VSYTCFDIDISDNVAHIKLSRPEKRNSMNLKFWDELPEIIGDIDREVRARVIVISSTGQHFSAGLDVQEFFNVINERGADERAHRITRGADFYQTVRHTGWLHRCRRGHGHGLRHALCDRRRLLFGRGDQYRHDG
jgi:enoyl-CoA hydratase